jgi:Zn-dependent protease
VSLFQTPLLRPKRLGHLFGVPIKVAPAAGLVFLLPLFLAADWQNAGWLSLALLTLFLSLLGHEIAHALMAKRLGLHVVDITIWPLVGMARIEEMSQHPTLEAPVAAAGPIFNLLIAPIGLLLPPSIGSVFLTINLIFGLGNLIPAFPMDGGRLLRAWFARRLPLPEATKRAIKISDTLILLALIPAAASGYLLLTILTGVYIWISGRWELAQLFLRPPGFAADAPTMQGQTAQSPTNRSKPPADEGDLENFKGSMKEFFHARKKNKS